MDGEKISTEGVKRALEQGNLSKAEGFLGRKFSLIRRVALGRKEGGKIGFPTINFDLEGLPLRRGVYLTTVRFEGKEYPSVTNVGAHPTFGDAKENVETYILDYNGNLYEREAEVVFLSYRREIVAFKQVEELSEAIRKDVEARRNYD